MVTDLSDALRSAADTAPPVRVPPGLFDRARRARARRQALALIATILIVAAAAALPALPRTATPTEPAEADALPSRVVVPPAHTADVRDAGLPRALVVYHRENLPGASWLEDAEPLAVVGSANQYRVYDRPTWEPATTTSPSFLLSPDGRYLLMPNSHDGTDTTLITDLRTGETRVSLDGTIAVAWTSDSRHVVALAHWVDNKTGWDRVFIADALTGAHVWQPPPTRNDTVSGVRDVEVAVSPDGDLTAYQHDATVSVNDIASFDARTFDLAGAVIAGGQAFTPAGDLVAQLPNGNLEVISASDGRVTGHLPTYTFPTVAGIPPTVMVVGWIGDTPVVSAADRVVVLSSTPRVLVQGPVGTDELQVATFALGQPTVRAGTPDPGPWLDRYRRWIPARVLGLIGLCVVAIAAFAGVRIRRRIRLRPRS